MDYFDQFRKSKPIRIWVFTLLEYNENGATILKSFSKPAKESIKTPKKEKNGIKKINTEIETGGELFD